MCAQFYPVSDIKKLAKKYKAKASKQLEKLDLTRKALPHSLAPVVVMEKGELIIKPMRFSLIPSWSKEPKVKFATHNARIETIAEKATWKKPFLNNHCVVPIQHFIEPIYEGEMAGNMVEFFNPDEEILSAAGIFDTWINKQTGEIIESFSIITDEPYPYIKKVGHDRSPFFLKDEGFELWLTETKKKSDELLSLLYAYKDSPKFNATKERPLKAGWEKRI